MEFMLDMILNLIYSKQLKYFFISELCYFLNDSISSVKFVSNLRISFIFD
jgi:hypothetical protein